MKINLIAKELKKIFKLRNVVVAVCVFLLLVSLSVFRHANSTIIKLDTENYPEKIPFDLKYYSVELKFKDMLLTKYGKTIDANELPLIREELQIFGKKLDEAIRNDEILKSAGFNADTRNYNGLIEVSPEVKQYCLSVTEGFHQYDGTDYPVYFERGFSEIVDYMEIAAEQGKPQVYHVMSDSFDFEIGEDMLFVLFAIVASTFILVPYMVSENKSKIALIEYSSKTGRKSYINKLMAVIIAQLAVVSTGNIAAGIYFAQWDISRYYDCKIDTMMFLKHMSFGDMAINNMSEISSKCYTGLTLLELYVLLLIGLSLCGILTGLLTAIISYRFDNIFAPFAIGLLLLSLPSVFFQRYIDYVFSDNRSRELLTTKYEPFIFIAVLMALTIIVIVIEIRRKKRAEI